MDRMERMIGLHIKVNTVMKQGCCGTALFFCSLRSAKCTRALRIVWASFPESPKIAGMLDRSAEN